MPSSVTHSSMRRQSPQPSGKGDRRPVVSQFAEMFHPCHAERRASPGERGPQIAPLLRELGQEAGISATGAPGARSLRAGVEVEASRKCVLYHAASGSSLPCIFALKAVAAANDAVSVELPGAAWSWKHSRDGFDSPSRSRFAGPFGLRSP